VISPGQKIDLELPLKIVRDGTVHEVKLGDLLTRRTIVSIYMRNNTPTCDRQADELAAHAAEFDRAGFNLVALSRDTCGSHRRYAAAKGIAFPLVSDPENRFARAADAVVEKSMYGRTFLGPARSAWVLAPDGTVLAIAPAVDAARHGAQLRALIKSL